MQVYSYLVDLGTSTSTILPRHSKNWFFATVPMPWEHFSNGSKNMTTPLFTTKYCRPSLPQVQTESRLLICGSGFKRLRILFLIGCGCSSIRERSCSSFWMGNGIIGPCEAISVDVLCCKATSIIQDISTAPGLALQQPVLGYDMGVRNEVLAGSTSNHDGCDAPLKLPAILEWLRGMARKSPPLADQ